MVSNIGIHSINPMIVHFEGGSVAVVKDWITAFNKDACGDEGLRPLLRETGGLEAIEVQKRANGSFVCIAKAVLSDEFLQIEFPVDYGVQNRGVKIEFVPPPAGFAVSRMPESELISAVRMRLSEQVGRGQFSGTAIIAKKGEPVMTFIGGTSNGDLNLNTKFNVGSMGKMFTAVGIMQLVEMGAIRLDDCVGQYLSDYPNQQVRNVTIRQLLNHTGGTGDIFIEDYPQKIGHFKTHKEYIDFFGDRSPIDVGQWNYSNYGYILLGRIIEKVTEQDYDSYIQKNVFEKAGMNSAGFYPKGIKTENLAVGFIHNDVGLESNESALLYKGTAAGGCYASASDMLNFANALTAHQLLNERHTALLTSNLVETGEGDRDGYGFFTSLENEEAQYFGHTGGHDGLNCSLDIYPKLGYTVIIMSNFGKPTANREAKWIRDRLPLTVA